MKLPLQITFRNTSRSDALEAHIRKKAEKLDQFCDTITSCRVMVEASHRHHHKGNLYRARIDITVPDRELVVSRDPKDNRAHEDAYVAIRDAFDAARRQVEDYLKKRRRNTKIHETPPHGEVLEVSADEGFGRITTPDGREIYFHRNSLLNVDFDQLEVGTAVRFDEENGDLGPQATTVKVVGKHHIVG